MHPVKKKGGGTHTNSFYETRKILIIKADKDTAGK